MVPSHCCAPDLQNCFPLVKLDVIIECQCIDSCRRLLPSRGTHGPWTPSSRAWGRQGSGHCGAASRSPVCTKILGEGCLLSNLNDKPKILHLYESKCACGQITSFLLFFNDTGETTCQLWAVFSDFVVHRLHR